MSASSKRGRRSAAPRRAALPAVLGALLLLVGCGTIPSAGPVEVGLPNLQQTDQYVQLYPSRPVDGSSQEEIVRGFVEAAASSTDDYAVAREFLTSDYANQWDPGFGVIIDSGTRPYHAEGDDAGVLSLSAVANVDSEGLMTPVESGPSTEMRFELERVGEEWRISSAPSGIILDSSTFTTIWASHQVYFVGPAGSLVPETHWYLSRAALPTEIVGDLLAGPSERLRGAVQSGFPSGTALVTSSVPIENGVARIDLTSQLLDADAKQLSNIEQQLRYSLQSVSGASDFEVRVEGSEISFPTTSDAPSPIAESAEPAMLIDGELGGFVAGEFTPITGFSGLADLRPDAVTIAADRQSAVLRNAGGVSRFSGQGITVIDDRPDLLAPTVDPLGFIWTAQQSSPQQMLVTGDEGAAEWIDVPWLQGRKTVAVRVSPDGSRLAALVRDGDHSAVLVSGVLRDEHGVPTGAGDEAEVQVWAEGEPLDFDWVGQQSFAVLTLSGETSKVTFGGPGSFSTGRGSVSGGRQISGGGSQQVRVLTEDGDLFAPQASGWQRAESGIELLAKRG